MANAEEQAEALAATMTDILASRHDLEALATRQDLHELAARTDLRFEKIDARFAQIDARFNNLEQRMNERFAEMDRRIDSPEVNDKPTFRSSAIRPTPAASAT